MAPSASIAAARAWVPSAQSVPAACASSASCASGPVARSGLAAAHGGLDRAPRAPRSTAPARAGPRRPARPRPGRPRSGRARCSAACCPTRWRRPRAPRRVAVLPAGAPRSAPSASASRPRQFASMIEVRRARWLPVASTMASASAASDVATPIPSGEQLDVHAVGERDRQRGERAGAARELEMARGELVPRLIIGQRAGDAGRPATASAARPPRRVARPGTRAARPSTPAPPPRSPRG